MLNNYLVRAPFFAETVRTRGIKLTVPLSSKEHNKLAESEGDSSNLSIAGIPLSDLFEELADWNHQLAALEKNRHDAEGPVP